MAEHKIAPVGDFHCGDSPVHWIAGDWRDVPSWARRVDEWLVAVNIFGPEIAIVNGDIVPQGTTDNLKQYYLNAFIDKVIDEETGLPCDRLDAIGNHDKLSFNGEDGRPSMATFIETIASGSPEKDNEGIVGNYPHNYTCDVDGIRYIHLSYPDGNGNIVLNGSLTWLEARLAENAALENPLPVVIFAHAHLWYDPGHPLTGTWATSHYADVYDVLDIHPEVQLVLGSHKHPHAWHYKRSDIHYLSVGGSVGIRQESDAGLKNNFAMITLDTEVIPTPYGNKANLKVVGTGTWTKSCSRVYDTFGVV